MCHRIEPTQRESIFYHSYMSDLIGAKSFSVNFGLDCPITPLFRTDQEYNIIPSKERIIVTAPVQPQDLEFAIPFCSNRIKYNKLILSRKISAGMHILPITDWSDHESFLVRFAYSNITFFDGITVSVDLFMLEKLNLKYFSERCRDMVEIHNKKVAALLAGLGKREKNNVP